MQSTTSLPSPTATNSCDLETLGDPDVTGFGVLSSFMFSILLVVVTIIWAYKAGALPRKYYNEFDDVILGRKNHHKHTDKVEAFESFMLSMSDQQLFLGFALVLSIYIIRYGVQDLDTKIPALAYTNAVMLAFFSCIIHLATMTVLRRYLSNRGVLKHIRVAIMGCLFVLLLPVIGEAWTFDPYMTVRCAVEDQQFLDNFWDKDPLTKRLGNAGLVLSLIILVGVLGSGYFHVILDLYTSDSEDFPTAWQIRLLAKTISKPPPPKDLLEIKQDLASKWSEKNLNRRGRLPILFLVIPRIFVRSFLFEIVCLIFYITFGITQVAYNLSGYDPEFQLVSFELRFGQFVPLVLLGLPILAWMEGYYCPKEDEPRHDPQERSASPSPTPPEGFSPEIQDAALITTQQEINDHHSTKLDRSESNSKESKTYGSSPDELRYERSSRFMELSSWIFLVSYLLICIYVAIAANNPWDLHITWGISSLMIIFAFVLSCVPLLISVVDRVVQLWKFRRELQRNPAYRGTA